MAINAIPQNIEPPSLLKTYIFDPILKIVKLAIRAIFQLIDSLRAFSMGDASFKMPSRQDCIHHFERMHPLAAQDVIYERIGRSYAGKIRWNEKLLGWGRTQEENIALGKMLAQDNPYLLYA